MSSEADERIARVLDLYLAAVPTPPDTTSREVVRRAIEFGRPPRLPYSFVQPPESDLFEAALLPALRTEPGSGSEGLEFGEFYHDEWGVGWEVTKRAWDHAIEHPLEDLVRLDAYRFPAVAARERYDWMAPWLERARSAGKYVVGPDPIGKFELLRSLMGFEGLMLAPFTQLEPFGELLDRLTELTIEIIEHYARLGSVDGFMTWQDFGLQTTLQMKADTFRDVYAPRYARIVDAAHAHGMHYIWHNCGQILDMLPTMIEIGVDVVQLDQPRLMGHRCLAEAFGGQICFWNTVDIQWATRDGVTDSDIQDEVKEMLEAFDRFGGGFIARHYPQPRDIQLSAEFHRASYDAFMQHGCALG